MKQPSRVPGLCEVQLLELSPRETDNELLNIEDSDQWEYPRNESFATILC